MRRAIIGPTHGSVSVSAAVTALMLSNNCTPFSVFSLIHHLDMAWM